MPSIFSPAGSGFIGKMWETHLILLNIFIASEDQPRNALSYSSNFFFFFLTSFKSLSLSASCFLHSCRADLLRALCGLLARPFVLLVAQRRGGFNFFRLIYKGLVVRESYTRRLFNCKNFVATAST